MGLQVKIKRVAVSLFCCLFMLDISAQIPKIIDNRAAGQQIGGNSQAKPASKEKEKPPVDEGSKTKKPETWLEITPSDTEYTVISESDGGYFVVSSNVSWEITNMSSYDWLAIWKGVNKYDEDCVFVQYNENTSTKDRYFSFTVKAKDKTKKISFTQRGAEAFIKASTNSVSHSSTSGNEYVTIETNLDDWKIQSEYSTWCKVSKDGKSVRISYETNTSASSRSFEFKVVAGNIVKNITATQDGVSLSLSSSYVTLTHSGGKQDITVNTSNSDGYEITSERLPVGCTVSQSGNTVSVVCSSNLSIDGRTGSFSIRAGEVSKTVSVSQSGVPVYLSTSPETANFKSSGKAKSGGVITVETNAPNWIIEDKPDWLSTTKKSSTLSLTAYKNRSSYERNGSVKISAGGKYKLIAINQAKREHYFRIKDDTWNCKYRVVGWTFGYVEKDWSYSNSNLHWGFFEQGSYVHGVQTGLRVDPYFAPKIFGLGLHTGLFYEFYFKNATAANTNYKFREHNLMLPVHLNYRIDFDKKGIFGIFFHGGANFDWAMKSKIRNDGEYDSQWIWHEFHTISYDDHGFNISVGYGGGFHLQRYFFDISTSRGLLNKSVGSPFSTFQNNRIKASLTIMFGH
ncbi:MAG: BACON domain-containing protein [Prevotellaceae bacterium]|nr:BACON domain-containing protein [Prevotellaceae bacterium]